MSGKRASPDSVDGSESRSKSPAVKRQKLVIFEPVRLPCIATVTELDRKTLAFTNRKLTERIQQRQRIESDLKKRIDLLEQRQLHDDNLMCAINRHWNQLDEDLRLLLQRFDAETAIEQEVENEAQETLAFLTLLNHYSDSELNDILRQRVEFSRRATAKLVQAFDRLNQRCERVTGLLKEEIPNTKVLNEALVSLTTSLQADNKKLQGMVGHLHRKNHSLSEKVTTLKDELAAAQESAEEQKTRVLDAEFELEKSRSTEEKLEHRLVDMAGQVQQLQLQLAESMRAGEQLDAAKGDGTDLASVSKSKLDELKTELEDQRELAAARLAELQELNEKYKEELRSNERHKLDMKHLPPELVTSTTEYVCLQSQFSVLYSESLQIRTQLEEARTQLNQARSAHLKQIEQMESEELLAQKQLRAEMIQLEDKLSQVRREYEMLRVEFEQNLAATEQSGPLTRETRQSLMSVKSQNQQLRLEMARFKKKWKEACNIIAKMQKEIDEEKKLKERCIVIERGSIDLKDTPTSPTVATHSTTMADLDFNVDTLSEDPKKLKERLRMLKAKLEAFAHITDEHREKADLMVLERRHKDESERLRTHVQKLTFQDGDARAKRTNEELQKRVKQLEEQNEHLKKDIATCKQEEDILLNEMEVTGNAYEDLQNQNMKLLQQLREKDDVNFKLMSERIRANQQQKLSKEERDLLCEQVQALHNQVEAQNLVVRKLEEKERLLQNNVTTVEKEIHLRQQALEMHKRKALEATQSAADLKLQLTKFTGQLAEAQAAVAEKTSGFQEEAFKISRLAEEVSTLRRKLDRAKQIEKAGEGSSDRILMEEIREMKEQLTCPSCKVKKKDAILLKCMHVFCYDCLKTRYEGRSRRCPKCQQSFTANEFHRIFLS